MVLLNTLFLSPPLSALPLWECMLVESELNENLRDDFGVLNLCGNNLRDLTAQEVLFNRSPNFHPNQTRPLIFHLDLKCNWKNK